uniref:Uncharacterized protein n=1 Tax=Desulfacinum infernum TaxID=35837 RepID=A0A832A3C8_9BACT
MINEKFLHRREMAAWVVAAMVVLATGECVATPPDLRIRLNGRFGAVTLLPSEPLTLHLQTVPRQSPAVSGDLWFLALTSLGSFWYTDNQWWVASSTPVPVRSGSFDVTPRTLLNGVGLWEGDFSFYAGWDPWANGLIDWSALTVEAASARVTTDPVALALDHLNRVMDSEHNDFYVYKDLDDPGNHFVLPARMGPMERGVSMDLGWTNGCFQGRTCIRCTFDGIDWGGFAFLNGTLEGNQTAPQPNWGTVPGAGIDLTGAARLCLAVRGETGGERVELFAFSINDKPYGDSARKVSTGFVTLTPSWQRLCLPVADRDLHYIINGFGWVSSARETGGRPIAFYVDDISFEKPGPNVLRFLRSYDDPAGEHPVFRYGAFTYDNALALMAYLTDPTPQNMARAKLLADALVYAVDHDRFFTDGRLRNAYAAGDLPLPNGWKPHGREGTTRLPGWSEPDGRWVEDAYAVSTHTGNVAWAILALLNYVELSSESPEQKAVYGNAAQRMAQWIENHCRDSRGAGGYTGGYQGWEATANNPAGQTKLLWKSTEHNLDVFVAFRRLAMLTGDPAWLERAEHAKRFLDSMWQESEGRFLIGTVDDGVTPNRAVNPMDVNTWGYLALAGVDGSKDFRRGLDWVLNRAQVSQAGYSGFDFNDDRDGIWWEGTAQMVVALELAGRADEASFYRQHMIRWQAEALEGDGKAIVAATVDHLTTGLDWTYGRKRHVGATAWFIFALKSFNPFWPKGIAAATAP